MKLKHARSLPNQSTRAQALEAAPQAAWRPGKGWVPRLRSVAGREALVWLRMQEEAVGGPLMAAHPPPPHTPLLSHHLERNTRVLKTLVGRAHNYNLYERTQSHPDNHPKGHGTGCQMLCVETASEYPNL